MYFERCHFGTTTSKWGVLLGVHLRLAVNASVKCVAWELDEVSFCCDKMQRPSSLPQTTVWFPYDVSKQVHFTSVIVLLLHRQLSRSNSSYQIVVCSLSVPRRWFYVWFVRFTSVRVTKRLSGTVVRVHICWSRARMCVCVRVCFFVDHCPVLSWVLYSILSSESQRVENVVLSCAQLV